MRREGLSQGREEDLQQLERHNSNDTDSENPLLHSSTTEINILKREFCDDLQQAVRSSVALLDSTLDSARSAANDGDAVPKKLRKKFKSEAEEAAMVAAAEAAEAAVAARALPAPAAGLPSGGASRKRPIELD